VETAQADQSSDSLATRFKALPYGVFGAILYAPSRISQGFNEGSVKMAAAKQTVSSYTGWRGALARTAWFPNEVGFGLAKTIYTPVQTIAGAPQGVHDLFAKVGTDAYAVTVNPSVNSIFDMGEDAFGVWGVASGSIGLYRGTGSLLGQGSQAAEAGRGLGFQNSEYRRFREQGYSAEASRRLLQPYTGVGQHFIQQAAINRTIGRLGEDSVLGQTLGWFRDSSFNVVSGQGMNTGRFYEYHARIHGGPAFGPRTAQGMRLLPGEPWRAANVTPALQPYGPTGYLWFGSPTALKLTVGGAAAAGGYGLYESLNDNE
jgi:hypothetical protein